MPLCRRLQRGCGVWGRGSDGLGTGAQGRGREGAEGVDYGQALVRDLLPEKLQLRQRPPALAGSLQQAGAVDLSTLLPGAPVQAVPGPGPPRMCARPAPDDSPAGSRPVIQDPGFDRSSRLWQDRR